MTTDQQALQLGREIGKWLLQQPGLNADPWDSQIDLESGEREMAFRLKYFGTDSDQLTTELYNFILTVAPSDWIIKLSTNYDGELAVGLTPPGYTHTSNGLRLGNIESLALEMGMFITCAGREYGEAKLEVNITSLTPIQFTITGEIAKACAYAVENFEWYNYPVADLFIPGYDGRGGNIYEAFGDSDGITLSYLFHDR